MRCKPIALATLLACSVNTPAFALSSDNDAPPTLPTPLSLQGTTPAQPQQMVPANTSNQNIASTLSFGDMGATGGLTLSGQQLQNGVSFNLPGDLVITDAHISLNVQVNRSDVSGENLQLMLNGQPLGAIPLDQLQQDKGYWQLDVPASMVASSNNLSFQLKTGDDIINNVWSCQRPLPADYKVTLQPESSLNYQGLWLNVRKTLGTFPRPFVDIKQTKDQAISIAYPATPDADVLTASAIVASQFGALSNGKPSRFDVQYDALPVGNGILIGKPGQTIGGITLPETNGAALQVIDNPQNPAWKLLIISGHNEMQLRQAAWRLTLPALPDSDTLDIPTLKIPQRAAYDAPRWINTEHPVAVRSLLTDEGALIAHGVWHGENRLPFRTAPDLFLWDGSSVPLHLNYSFAQKNWIDDQDSFLNVSLNGEFLKRLPVSKEGMLAPVLSMLGLSQRQQSAVVNIDPRAILGSNQLGFWFGLKAQKNAPCNAMADENIQSRIDGDSTLDFSRAWHFGKLPNLAWFSGAMFPFTRHADLAQTTVLMPAHPTVDDATVLLNLMAQSGRDTGVTANYLHLYTGLPGQEEAQQQLADSDVLAIGSLSNGEMLNPLLQNSAFALNENTLEVKTASAVSRVLSLLRGDQARTDMDAAEYLSDNNQWRGLLSMRSPWNAQRVVVVATATDNHQLSQLAEDMNKPAFLSIAGGDFTAVNSAGEIKSWRVGEQFTSGNLPGYMKILWFASEHIFWLVALACLIAAVSGPMLFTLLQRHAQQRLQDKTKK
ncbi:cellulose biosynthesis cyclic di-GMP-binding regulatory protein BcsB [Kosakonia radicincitans]|uniref:cellulose biosynthesis cyclic di-GMP-binding regulatory protein BcsB n=1 Tax=Kosakonia radicincitans TaxID=283686 RepID=UPI0008D34918|nr:cellulose biosynthesis cyclic di-GMP-binding regulatory protein BcsB [Kosakonia radicincitans]SET32195.1 cellulose synthase subunit [Kosakonia radicincitans]